MLYQVRRLVFFICFVMLLVGVGHGQTTWNNYIYGMHEWDQNALDLMKSGGQARGWVLVMVQLEGYNGGTVGDITTPSNQGFGVVVRMNWGFGSSGSLPTSSNYATYAQRAATLCSAHRNYCRYYIVGNETNLGVEWPNGGAADGCETCNGFNGPCVNPKEALTHQRYANCFQQTYNAVHAVAPECNLLLSPAATWAGNFSCSLGEPTALDYICYTDTLYQLIPHSMIGGMAFHPKTHVHDPAEITSNTMHDNPVFSCSHNLQIHWGFRVYQDELNRIPSDLRSKAIFFTELNPHEPSYGGWQNIDNGYVVAGYEEVNNWNKAHPGDRVITGMMLYRWPVADFWPIANKPNLHNDIRNAVAKGYTNQYGGSTNTPTIALPTQTPTPSATANPNCNILVSEGKSASCSTYFQNNSTYGPAKAVDGQLGRNDTRWVSDNAPSAAGHWLVVDLGQNYDLCAAHVYGDEANTEDGGGQPVWNPSGYFIRASNANSGDPRTWTELARYEDPCGQPYADFPGTGVDAHNIHPISGNYRYVCLHVDRGDGDCGPHTRIQEFRVFAQGTGPNPTATFTTIPPTYTPVPPNTATRTPTVPVVNATPTATRAACPGDADKSGFINGDDFRSVRDNFGRSGCGAGDADGDCFVNGNDFRAVRDNFGRSCPAR